MFGLGFDTSSEIAILGISSIQATKGTSIWLILIFPILFTAGMCLLDTTDGALMMSLYTSTQLARDPIAICYYSIVLTVITVIVAIIIGTVQFLNLILNVAEPHGKFWDGVERLGEAWDIVGTYFLLTLRANIDTVSRRSNMRNVHSIGWLECDIVQAMETSHRQK
jgi:high-affinity nickel-transport protein